MLEDDQVEEEESEILAEKLQEKSDQMVSPNSNFYICQKFVLLLITKEMHRKWIA